VRNTGRALARPFLFFKGGIGDDSRTLRLSGGGTGPDGWRQQDQNERTLPHGRIKHLPCGFSGLLILWRVT
jgi:hypothetical protein